MSSVRRFGGLWLALAGPAALVAVWAVTASLGVFPESLFPTPWAVARALGAELANFRLIDDAIASLFRVSLGFLLAVGLGVPDRGNARRSHPRRPPVRARPWPWAFSR